ncbi:cerberus [Engystomops pustulosus]|uniref:cerberus n=1 Tax=Engystomops pustulosus TaxID=76066 RepID=UPI003AFA904B
MLILQLLIVSYISCHGEAKDKETRGRSKFDSIIHQYHLKNENNTLNSWEPDKNIGKDKALSGIRRNDLEINRVPKTRPKYRHRETNTHGMNLPKMMDYGVTRSNQFNGRKEDDSGKYAEVFWNYFTYKMNAASEAVNYPVKTKEVQREVCKTLPFTQNIIHENCDKVVIQNNLCFGKCNSLYVPNQRDELNICSRCLPFKFTMNHLKLNCTGSANVVKIIMMVEECKCVIHGRNSHRANKIKDTSHYGHH